MKKAAFSDYVFLFLATLTLHLLEPLDVSQVLKAPRGLLVHDQMVARQNWNRHAAELRLHSVNPRGRKLNAIDRGDDVDSNRGHTDLENQARRRQVLFG